MSKKFKIGTRGSLLALTQCNLFKNELEKKSGLSFELEVIKTQGDLQTDKPLWQMDGKDFFTKELDHALLAGEVDMVVHSYKDLGSERPEGITLGCISERFFANDILLIKKKSIPLISQMNEFKVGTSSPRRIVNAEKNLANFLPGAQANLKVKCEMLRGNVNTRIQKLIDQDLDAIILALAGLERLASNKESSLILEKLIKDLDFMVMPQDFFPSSASQGALAVEVSKKTPSELIDALKLMDHSTTREEVARERRAFNSYGGGCHLAVGINVKKVDEFFIHTHQGLHDKTAIEKIELEGFDYKNIQSKNVYFPYKRLSLIGKKYNPVFAPEWSNVFVTSKHCFHSLEKTSRYKSIWAAGSSTHQALAKQGYWINGNCISLGASQLDTLAHSNALKLFLTDSPWVSLSHNEAKENIGTPIASYERSTNSHIDPSSIPKDTHVIFWSSFNEYCELTKIAPELKTKLHACGLGKTYKQFKENNISVTPFINQNHATQICKEIQ